MILSNTINWLNSNSIIIINILLIIFSIIVLTRINPMISLFNALIFYVLLAFLLYFLNLNLLAILYILIYVGAISVLFIFILSLINIKYSELYYKTYFTDLWLIIYSFILTLIFIIIIMNNMDISLFNNFDYLLINIESLDINNVLEMKIIGELLYTEYSILFILLGLILLLSIISAILLIYR